MNNPIQMIKMLMGKSTPEQMVNQLMSNNNNPMLNNLVKMAKEGNTQDIETFAKNLCNERGVDFNKEFSDFMNNFK